MFTGVQSMVKTAHPFRCNYWKTSNAKIYSDLKLLTGFINAALNDW